MSQNLEMIRGDSLVLDLEVSREGAPVDITGALIWMTAKESLDDDDDDAVFQKTVGGGVALTDPEAGLARITVAPADTADMEIENDKHSLFYDIQVKYAGGTFTVKSGKLIVRKDVTLATA